MGKSKKISPSPRFRADGRTLAKFEALRGSGKSKALGGVEIRPSCNVCRIVAVVAAELTRWTVGDRRPMASTSPSPSTAKMEMIEFM